jgi:hypothetical protein
LHASAPAHYRSGRSETCLKSKCVTVSSFILIGTDRDRKTGTTICAALASCSMAIGAVSLVFARGGLTDEGGYDELRAHQLVDRRFDYWRNHRWTLATQSRNSARYSGRCLATRHFGGICPSRLEVKHDDWRDGVLRGAAGKVHPDGTVSLGDMRQFPYYGTVSVTRCLTDFRPRPTSRGAARAMAARL